MKILRPWLALLAALVLLAATVTIIRAGPLSDSEVIRALGGMPTGMQGASCSSTASRSLSVLPTGQLIRLSPDGGSVYYRLGDSTVASSLTIPRQGAFLPQNTVEYIQNAENQYVGCMTATGTATLSVSVMQ